MIQTMYYINCDFCHGRVKLNGKVYSAGYFSTSHEAGAKVSQLRKELGVLDGIGEGG